VERDQARRIGNGAPLTNKPIAIATLVLYLIAFFCGGAGSVVAVGA
jgi:hypothetical protein